MMENSKTAEAAAVLDAARKMCAAARTAPKTRGIDNVHTCILTGSEKDALAEEMERLATETGTPFFGRDAKNLRASLAVVLIGSSYSQRGLGERCSFCNFKGCDDCAKNNAVCVYDPMDLGIALGSAVSIAADSRIDSRVMFSVGRAAVALGLLGPEVKAVIGVPLSVSGKSPFFDRK